MRIVCAFVNIAMNGFGEAFFADVLGPLVDAAVKARQWTSENGEFAPSNTVTGIFAGTSGGFAGQNSSCNAPK